MLLIVITVAAAVLMYAYVSGLTGRLQGASNAQPYLEQVVLDYYDWTKTSSLNLTVRNVGVSKVTLAGFYVAGKANTTALTFGSGCNSPRGVLNVQSSCVITFPMPTGFTASPGFEYTVKLTTKDGAVFSYSCVASTAS